MSKNALSLCTMSVSLLLNLCLALSLLTAALLSAMCADLMCCAAPASRGTVDVLIDDEEVAVVPGRVLEQAHHSVPSESVPLTRA